MEKCFIRYGEIPPDEFSKNHLTGEYERGTSVYEAIKENGVYKIMFPINVKTSILVDLSGNTQKNCYEVTGDLVGYCSDNLPLLINVHIKEKLFSLKD